MLLIPLLLLGQAAAGLSRPASPYTISVSTLVLRSSGDPLAVAVTGPANGSHWLGMFLLGSNLTAIARYHDYCPPGGCAETTPPFTATAPIKYWGLSNGKNLSTFSVFTINYRKPCFFAVFAGTELPRLVATSQHATFSRLSCEPTGVHLARTQTPGELRVTWQSGESNESSLRWRPAAGAVGGGGERAWQVVRAESSTYARDKLCGLPANMSIGWHDPGWIHTATFRGGDIEYAVGSGNCSDGLGALWSESRTVRAPPTPDAESVAVLFIGDMGEAPRDHPGSSHHWQMPQPTEVVDAMIAATSAQHYDAVWHVGDLAYATGYGSIWDGYMKQIEPLASIMPYYTSPGNHERDTPGTGAFQHGDDSGGECGVPFNARFIQPAGDKHSALPPSNSSDNVASWYSDNIGPIHVIFASTEHDYHPGSAQHAWLLRDLRAVDRKVTPFLVFSGHRPMYSSTTVGENAPHPYHVAGNASYNWQMGGVLEPLFEEYRVDLALWGHVHNCESPPLPQSPP